MPDVSVRRNALYLNRPQVLALFRALPAIAVAALSAPGKELEEKDIVIRDFIHSENDVGTMDLEITIMTEDSPERSANIQERTDQVVAALEVLSSKVLPDYVPIKKGRNNVWICLVKSGFSIF